MKRNALTIQSGGKSFLGFLVFGLMFAGLYIYLQYNKPHRDVQNTEADYTLSAKNLFSEFKNDEKAATKKYSGKVIVVTGEVLSKTITVSTANIVLKTDDALFGINCGFLESQLETVKTIEKNTNVKVKGECQGYKDDVILGKCAIIQ